MPVPMIMMQHLEQEAQWASQFSDMLGELKQELFQAAESVPGKFSATRMSQG
jgi:hypothetical protein